MELTLSSDDNSRSTVQDKVREEPHISAKRVVRQPDNLLNSETITCPGNPSLLATQDETSSLQCRNVSTDTSIMLKPDEITGAVLLKQLAGDTTPSHTAGKIKSKENLSQQHAEIKINNEPNISMHKPMKETTIQFIRNLNAKGTRMSAPLGFLPIGLHPLDTDSPTWNFALLDSGCTDNLISLRTLQNINNFDKIIITTVPNTSIRCANNDTSQQILRRTSLLLSLLDTNNKRICFRTNFYIVNGLVHDIFLGQPFLTSPQLHHSTQTSIFFHNSDQVNPEPHVQTSNGLYEIPITYNVKRHLTNKGKATIPPKQIAYLEVNCQNFTPSKTDICFYAARPTKYFKQKYPKLHMMHQTVHPTENCIQISIANTSTRPITIKANHSLAKLQTHLKSETSLQDLPDLLSKSTNNITTKVSLNKSVHTHNITRPDLSVITECNQAYASSLH